MGPLGTAHIKRHARRKLLLLACLTLLSLESDIICCSSIVLLILQHNSLGFQHIDKTICDVQHCGMNNYQILSLPVGKPIPGRAGLQLLNHTLSCQLCSLGGPR